MLHYPTKTDRQGLRFLEYYAPHNVYHCGTDFNFGTGNQDKGQPVECPTDGVVEYVSPRGTNGGLGNYVVVYHPWHGVWTRYLHLDRIDCMIGQILKPKDLIGTLGDSGTTSAHCHFEVLNFKGLAFIKDWFRPYGRYPSGLSRFRVSEMFLDPIPWIETNNHHKGLEVQLEQARRAIIHAKGARLRRLHRLIERIVLKLSVIQ